MQIYWWVRDWLPFNNIWNQETNICWKLSVVEEHEHCVCEERESNIIRKSNHVCEWMNRLSTNSQGLSCTDSGFTARQFLQSAPYIGSLKAPSGFFKGLFRVSPDWLTGLRNSDQLWKSLLPPCDLFIWPFFHSVTFQIFSASCSFDVAFTAAGSVRMSSSAQKWPTWFSGINTFYFIFS